MGAKGPAIPTLDREKKKRREEEKEIKRGGGTTRRDYPWKKII